MSVVVSAMRMTDLTLFMLLIKKAKTEAEKSLKFKKNVLKTTENAWKILRISEVRCFGKLIPRKSYLPFGKLFQSLVNKSSFIDLSVVQTICPGIWHMRTVWSWTPIPPPPMSHFIPQPHSYS